MLIINVNIITVGRLRDESEGRGTRENAIFPADPADSRRKYKMKGRG
jgi:hypothetical protein